MTDADPLGNNPIYADGQLVGRSTGGNYGFRIEKSLALAMVRPEHAEARHRAGDDHPRREAPGHRDPREPLRPRESAPEELSRIRHQSGSRPSAVSAGLRTLRSRSDRRSREPITPVRRPCGSEHQRPAGAGMRSRARMLEAPIACSPPNPERARRGAPHPAITITERQDERLAGLTRMSPPGIHTLPSRCGPRQPQP